MEHAVTAVLTVARSEAGEIRPILQKHAPDGAQFTERRSWLLWVRFTISGPSATIARLQRDLDARDTEQFIQDAW